MGGLVIDLSHPLRGGMAVFPGDMAPEVETRWREAGGYRITRLALGAHTGTHLDAPGHALADGATIEALAPGRFFGPGRVLALEGVRIIDAEHLRPHEGALVALGGRGGWALLRTGWSRCWSGPGYYEDWPHLSTAAAALLAGAGLSGIGLDTPSVDPARPEEGQDPLAAHRVLGRAGLCIVENLTGLERLPASGFAFCCAPLPLEGGEGSPVRALAWLDS
ncbi:MAG: cyclase family protein [Desulfovibrionaceae bacterium]